MKAVRRRVHSSTYEFLHEWVMTWCPGCEQPHPFRVSGRGEVWEWDGDLEAPTFSPSYLTWAGQEGEAGYRRCHSFLRAGVWEFLTDCTHGLAGRRVPMVDLPAWLTPAADRPGGAVPAGVEPAGTDQGADG